MASKKKKVLVKNAKPVKKAAKKKVVAKAKPVKAIIVKKEDWVSVEYEGKFSDGKVFDTSKGKGPLTFKAGLGMVVPGFDKAVIGMKTGMEKTVKIKAKDAYGEKNKKVVELPKNSFQGADLLKEGKEFELMSNMGPLVIHVIKVEKEKVKAILNHPLAGKDLTFKIKVDKVLSNAEIKEMEKTMTQQSCGCDCEEEHCNTCH